VLEGAQLCQLVLRQGLGRIYIERAPFRVLEQSLKDGEVVAERLPARGRRNHHEVPAVADGVIGFRLMRVQALDSTPSEGGDQLRLEAGGERSKYRGDLRNQVVERYITWKVGRVEVRDAGHDDSGRVYEH